MKKNEKYWLELYNSGKIEINFETGEVFSYLSRGNHKHLLDGKHNAGYLSATAGESRTNRNQILLHRLIWICANGEIPEDIEVNHKNGIKIDNRLENLELVTKSENALHSRRILGKKGGVQKGESSGMAKLTEKDVLEIRNRYDNGEATIRQMSNEYEMCFQSIWGIVKHLSWRHVP